MQSEERRAATNPVNKEKLLLRRIKLAARGSIAEWNSACECDALAEIAKGDFMEPLPPPAQTESDAEETAPPYHIRNIL